MLKIVSNALIMQDVKDFKLILTWDIGEVHNFHLKFLNATINMLVLEEITVFVTPLEDIQAYYVMNAFILIKIH